MGLFLFVGVLIEGGVSRQAYGGTKIQDSLYISLLENRYKFNTPVEKLLVRYICEQVSDPHPCDGNSTTTERQL